MLGGPQRRLRQPSPPRRHPADRGTSRSDGECCAFLGCAARAVGLARRRFCYPERPLNTAIATGASRPRPASSNLGFKSLPNWANQKARRSLPERDAVPGTCLSPRGTEHPHHEQQQEGPRACARCSDLVFRWWRGRDLNPRPWGYGGLDKRPASAAAGAVVPAVGSSDPGAAGQSVGSPRDGFVSANLGAREAVALRPSRHAGHHIPRMVRVLGASLRGQGWGCRMASEGRRGAIPAHAVDSLPELLACLALRAARGEEPVAR